MNRARDLKHHFMVLCTLCFYFALCVSGTRFTVLRYRAAHGIIFITPVTTITVMSDKHQAKTALQTSQNALKRNQNKPSQYHLNLRLLESRHFAKKELQCVFDNYYLHVI